MWWDKKLDLGWEPYQTELDELVEKEIVAVVCKNEERKKRKGKEGMTSTQTVSTSDFNERLLQVEDFMERWDEKLDSWGTMITKLYEVQLGKLAPRISNELVNDAGNSDMVPSVVSGGSKDSADENESAKSYAEDESQEGRSSHEDNDQSADKSPEMVKSAGKQKEVAPEEGVAEDPERGRENGRSVKESGVCKCEVRELPPQSPKKKVSLKLSWT